MIDPNRKKLLLISIIIIVVALIVGNSIFRTQSARVERLKAKVAQEKQKNRILIGIQKIEDEINSFLPRLLPKKDQDWLRRQATRIANESNVEILSISPKSPQDRGLYVWLPIGMEVECGYHQLGNFISLLESSRNLIWLESLDLTRKEINGKVMGKAKIVVSTFYLKD